MKIFKKSGKINISELKLNELLALLKIQIPCELVFTKTDAEDNILIGERLLDGKVQKIEYTSMGETKVTGYKELLEEISQLTSEGYLFVVSFENNDFRKQENLLSLIPDINPDVVTNCVFLMVDEDGMYTIMYKPFGNNDSNKLFYFEDNNTLMAFTEQGPLLVTDSPKISSIMDIICN